MPFHVAGQADRGQGLQGQLQVQVRRRLRRERTRNGKKTVLESGATGTGKTTSKKVGKGLKAGKYQLKVTMNSGNKSASAKETLKIKK